VRLDGLCDSLRRIRGVHQLRLVTTTALLPPLHEQDEATEKSRKTRSAAA
jgi:CopG family nickel-responsive transcriptional regulator